MRGSSILFTSVVSLLILLNNINGQQMELVASHVLFRHGDRTPITTFPTDPVKEKDWPNGFGQLTIAGIEQHHRLGRYLRTRYGSLLSSNYTASEITVRSTDYDRTLMSAQSNLIGLYPLYNISDDKVPIQPIPIHTVPMNQDFLLGVSECPRYDQVEDEINHSDEVKKMDTYYEAFFKKLQVWTNITNITIYNAWDLADTVFVEHLYNKTPSWADDDVRKNLSDINNLAFHFIFSSNDTKRIRGGPLIQDIWWNMNNASLGKRFTKVKLYSAHDTTVSGALAFLGINYPHQPPYASALFVDLYKQNSAYFVKVEYLNVTDSNISYPYILDGCPGLECPLDKFTSIYQARFPASSEVECAKTSPPSPSPSDGGNRKLTVILTVAIVGLVLIIFTIFFCLYIRRRERDLPLLAAESGYQVA